MFRTDLLSIIRVLILYSQQLVFVIVMLTSASEVRMELHQLIGGKGMVTGH